MKYIKTFEIESNQIIVGHYAICQETDVPNELIDFLSKNIGRIITKEGTISFKIKYKNVPDSLSDLYFSHGIRVMRTYEIIETAPTIKELKLKLTANKFNL